MARSKPVRRQVSRPLASRTAGVACLFLLFGSAPGWGAPPDPTPSDSLGNTAGGSRALSDNTTGEQNTAFGYNALLNNISGTGNTAIGLWALIYNTTGSGNTASGVDALVSNTTGDANTASGYGALYQNNGTANTASGYGALYSNTEGNNNTASGLDALFRNTRGDGNTASGYSALYHNNGSASTASGLWALFQNIIGYDNTASGDLALYYTTGDGNTAVGASAGELNATGTYNTFIGCDANTNAGNYTNGTALGNGATLTASNSIVLGNGSISRIYANVTSITSISDRRHKKDIKALDADLGLDFIEKLQPVSYRFNNGDETERYGFIAQDLEQALPASLHNTIERSEPEHGLALIERQHDEDRTYRISYDDLIAPMVKAIQQQQHEMEAVRQQNADLRKALKAQAAAFKAENADLRHWIGILKEQVAAAR
jgi:trimeric autotransporter adhesin